MKLRPPQAGTNQFLGLWATTNSRGQVVVVAADFEPVERDQLPGWSFVPSDYKQELRALVDIYVRRTLPSEAVYNFHVPMVSQNILWFDSKDIWPSVVVHEVLCGLWLGMTNELSPLFESVSFRVAFTNTLAGYMRARANSTWESGRTNLQSGRALQLVLEAWEEHARVFGTNVVPEIPEYVDTLKQQLGEFQRLRDSTIEDPLALPPKDRAEYYVDRLSQATRSDHGIGTFKAGYPAPDLVSVGREAFPALLSHLEDRRLTRVRGDERTKAVLVQDLALDCFEAIAGGSVRTNFLTFGRFSSLSSSQRDEIVSSVRAWFSQYGTKPESLGKLALAESKPISRLFILEEEERHHPGLVDGIAYLKRWAAEERADELRALAWRLGSRGDRSLLPRVRESVRKGNYQNADCLVPFGEPEDWRLLREVIRKQMVSPKVLDAHVLLDWIVELALGKSTNQFVPPPFAVPILVDALECRRLTPASTYPKTLSDVVFPALLKLTPHLVEYVTNAPMSKRMSAIDQWQKWWESEGSDSFSKQDPEVEALFGKMNPENGLEAPQHVPMEVLALSYEPGTEYKMSGEQALGLAKDGQFRLRLFDTNAIGRFLAPAAEKSWAAQHEKAQIRERGR
jgi:hypothetical protein